MSGLKHCLEDKLLMQETSQELYSDVHGGSRPCPVPGVSPARQVVVVVTTVVLSSSLLSSSGSPILRTQTVAFKCGPVTGGMSLRGHLKAKHGGTLPLTLGEPVKQVPGPGREAVGRERV